jgi:hypothetical protein
LDHYWRWQTHLYQLPLCPQFMKPGIEPRESVDIVLIFSPDFSVYFFFGWYHLHLSYF